MSKDKVQKKKKKREESFKIERAERERTLLLP
jgi:hypothetical protein